MFKNPSNASNGITCRKRRVCDKPTVGTSELLCETNILGCIAFHHFFSSTKRPRLSEITDKAVSKFDSVTVQRPMAARQNRRVTEVA